MCGGYELDADPDTLAEAFGVDQSQLSAPIPREHFPRSLGPIVLTRPPRGDRLQPERWLGLSRWGLVPSWAGALSVGDKLFNARAETLAQKPAFRAAFERRRCVVPVSAFYEWSGDKPRRRFLVKPEGEGLLALAGLWEIWRSPDGEKVGSYTVITVPPNATLAPIHGRMPAVLRGDAVERWLSLDTPPADLAALLTPCPDELLHVAPG